MRGSRKNGERGEQVRKGKKGSAKLEPLRPQAEQPDKFYNDLAKFPEENPYPVMRIHKDGTVLYANKASQPLLKARNSGVGQPAPAEWRRLVEKVLASGRVAREEVKDDGRVFALRVVPIADTNYVNFYGVDITEQKRSEQELQASEERYRSLFEQAADAIVVFEPQTQKMVEFNNKAREMLGYTREEFSNLRISDVEAIESPEEVAAHINKIVKQTGDTFETRQRKKDGTIIDVLVSAKLITIAGKQYIQGIWRDITEQRAAKKELLKYQKQLKKLAAQLALTEERERRRIARNLHDQVSQYLALAKIKLDTMLASEKSVPLAETIKETSDVIEKAIQETRSLTFDLSYPILYELGFEAAVAEWLNEQVKEKHKIAVEFEDDGQPKPLDDDVRTILFRNFRELLINIIKHARADKVKVSVARIEDSINVTIEDNGVGFDAAQISAAKRAGFGLFSIRERLEEFGGHFTIESKPGAGCKAVMTAPLKNKSCGKEG